MAADTYVGDAPRALDDVRIPRGTTAAAWAAATSVVASAVHVAVAPEHLAGSLLHGSFFVAVALAQATLAGVVLHRPTLRSSVIGLAGTVGVVLLYVASRTVGLPAFTGAAAGHAGHGTPPLAHQPIPGTIGPGMPVMPGLEGHPGVDPVGLLDLVALSAELATVVALLALLPQGRRRVAANLLAALGASLWATALLFRGT